MDVVLCHRMADFGVLGAAVGYTRLHPGTRIVLCGGAHPMVRDFLALYRDEYSLIEQRSVSPHQLRTITVVDAQRRELLGTAAEWLDLPQVEVRLYDHRVRAESDIAAQSVQIEVVGSTTTLIVEHLQAKEVSLSMAEATVMALGVHVDTGSLTYDHVTIRDAAALTWLMGKGANQRTIATHRKPGFPAQLIAPVPLPTTAATLMSAPVRTILPSTSIDQARLTLLRYGHSGLSVVDLEGQLIGILSRRDLDIALHHGFGHAPVEGYMSAPVRTITPETTLPEIEALMVTYDIGRLPVLRQNQLVGIVTRTDLLRQLYYIKRAHTPGQSVAVHTSVRQRLDQALPPKLREILEIAAAAAQARGWQLYLVGGAVRDLLRVPEGDSMTFREFDLVVDGADTQHLQGAGVELAHKLQESFAQVQLQVYGQFQTAALSWHNDPNIGSFAVDIATARSEFYPYPAANPEVTASSIRQDLYRRDFTVNALAVRLTRQGTQCDPAAELLDFFGGLEDLKHRKIRVLHPNSFIEDPTRIFRAVRFATRLEFTLEAQTEAYIRHAISSDIYQNIQKTGTKAPALQSRLQTEIKYMFQLPNWAKALKLMNNLGALQCIHASLSLDQDWWRRVRLALHWHQQFDCLGKAIPPWLLILELLLLSLPEAEATVAAAQLQLPQLTQIRLKTFSTAQARTQSELNKLQLPSQVVATLKSYSLPLLIELAAVASVSVRRQIWLYLTRWQSVRPLITGADLMQLGYRSGPQFKTILEAILAATLDQKIQTKADAITWVIRSFPSLMP